MRGLALAADAVLSATLACSGAVVAWAHIKLDLPDATHKRFHPFLHPAGLPAACCLSALLPA